MSINFIASLYMVSLQIPSPLDRILIHPGIDNGVELFMKRDDLIHPEISGNKWRKLKFNIEFALQQLATTLISAGGPWSNHLAALAAAGNYLNLKTVGIVRGTEPHSYSETLIYCRNKGMDLIFLSKPNFSNLPEYISQIQDSYPDSYFIPLGGDNELGTKGCMELASELSFMPDVVVMPVGTGTTLKGVAQSLPSVKIIGFSALKNANQHSTELNKFIEENKRIDIIFQPEFGGFAKTNQNLNDFIISFHQHNNIVLEPVYTGKMMFGLFKLLENDPALKNKSIISIHTGGLQGLKGYADLHRQLFTS